MSPEEREETSWKNNYAFVACFFSVVIIFLLSTDINYVSPKIPGSSSLYQKPPSAQQPRKSIGHRPEENWDIPYCLYYDSINGKRVKIEQFVALNHLINLNKANSELLTLIHGIGPNLAADIIEYREHHGGFTHKSELLKVPGFGPQKYLTLNHIFTVEDDVND